MRRFMPMHRPNSQMENLDSSFGPSLERAP
jgi:hypothetical protein